MTYDLKIAAVVDAFISCIILVAKLAICQKIAEKEQLRLKANREQAQMCALNKFREVLDHQVPPMRFCSAIRGRELTIVCAVRSRTYL